MAFFSKFFGNSDSDSDDDNPIAWFKGEDPGMQKAIELAQQNYPKFASAVKKDAQRIVPAAEASLMKYAFPAQKRGVEVEHMFLGDIYFDGENIVGTLASQPMYTRKVKEGDEVIVDPERVTDWVIVIDGKCHGGYTFKFMWKNFSKEERRMYAEHPPFEWMDLG